MSAADETAELVEVGGISIPLDRRIMSDLIVESLRAGRYEMGEARALPRLIRQGERVVEVGAGIGFLTALIAKRTPAELVVAIEANPRLQAYIAELHRLNGVRPILRQALVTPEPAPGPATLFVHQDLWASSPGWIKPRDQLEAAEVPVLSLPEIAATWRPTLLIVDVEPFAAWTSAEGPPHALAGADFRPFERVLLELKPKRFPPPQVKRIFDHFSAQGFAYDPALSAGPLVLFGRLAG
jgi:FkbM family methyltransferase